MNRNEYNGWTNYETWLVNLWMSNDAGSYEYFNELALEVITDSDDDNPTVILAERIKDVHEEMQEEQTGFTGLYADLINAAMSEVNWDEIADHLIADNLESELA